MRADGVARPAAEVVLSIGFFTRLPTPLLADPPPFARALWAAPVAGALVGLIVGLVLTAAMALGLPAGAATALALATGMLVTGALHEDGLADVADGFGGGRDPAARLAIMRDSRIGTYGALALGISLLVRWSALTALVHLPAAALVCACIAAHAASRALLPAFLAAVPAARGDGLGAGAAGVPGGAAATALALGAAGLLLSGAAVLLWGAAALAILFVLLRHLCLRLVGGQTGDVLGALQQAAEAAILVTIATLAGRTA